MEIRGHQALLSSGSGFSHHVFLGWLRGAGRCSGYPSVEPWELRPGRPGEPTSGEAPRPLGVCRKCCRAGISCSRPWEAGHKQQGAHLEPQPTHTRGGSSSASAFPKPWGHTGGCGAGPGILQGSFLEQLGFPLDAGRCSTTPWGHSLVEHPRNGFGGAPKLLGKP